MLVEAHVEELGVGVEVRPYFVQVLTEVSILVESSV